jgi:hypothetical protein
MGKFKPGQSGNPSGRPKGALNKTTLATQALLDGEAEALTRKLIELAKNGHPMALRLCLERLLPARKDRPIHLTLPKMEGEEDLPEAIGAVLEAVTQGEITPAEGQILVAMLETYSQALETKTFKDPIRDFDKLLGGKKS